MTLEYRLNILGYVGEILNISNWILRFIYFAVLKMYTIYFVIRN